MVTSSSSVCIGPSPLSSLLLSTGHYTDHLISSGVLLTYRDGNLNLARGLRH